MQTGVGWDKVEPRRCHGGGRSPFSTVSIHSPLSPLQVDLVTDTAMARSGPCPALLLPLVQLTVCLALASRQSCYDRNYVFRHHMDLRWLSCNRHNSYCNMRMKKMTIYGKPVNTFVHAPSEHLNHICMGNGIPIPPNLLRSTRFYLATTCTYNKSLSYTGRLFHEQIIVGCCLQGTLLLPLTPALSLPHQPRHLVPQPPPDTGHMV